MNPEKPSKNEDEYFVRRDLEKKKQWESERLARMADEERKQLRETHYMKCPKCGMDLHEFELEDVKIDRCVSCGGTWLDESEMEEILKHHSQGPLARVMSIFK
ncbi:MAG: zf-TFIIB domain-containing protein [Acidobacteriota bacterium]